MHYLLFPCATLHFNLETFANLLKMLDYLRGELFRC